MNDNDLEEFRTLLFGEREEQSEEPVEEPKPPPEPYQYPQVPVINGQANTPTGPSHADIERSQNLSRLFGGHPDGIRN